MNDWKRAFFRDLLASHLFAQSSSCAVDGGGQGKVIATITEYSVLYFPLPDPLSAHGSKLHRRTCRRDNCIVLRWRNAYLHPEGTATSQPSSAQSFVVGCLEGGQPISVGFDTPYGHKNIQTHTQTFCGVIINKLLRHITSIYRFRPNSVAHPSSPTDWLDLRRRNCLGWFVSNKSDVQLIDFVIEGMMNERLCNDPRSGRETKERDETHKGFS